MHRWSKMDQPLFLLAYFLHPGKKTKHLNITLEPFAWTVNIVRLASETFMRFFGEQPASEEDSGSLGELSSQLIAYLNGKDFFGTALPHMTTEEANPTEYWELLEQVSLTPSN